MKRFDSFNLLTALPCCSDRPFYEQNLHLSAQIRLPELDFPRFPMAAWDWEAKRLDSGSLDLGCCLLSFTNKHRSHHIPLMCGACWQKHRKSSDYLSSTLIQAISGVFLVSVFQEYVASKKTEKTLLSFWVEGPYRVTIESCPFLRKVFRYLEPFSTPLYCSFGVSLWQWPITMKNSKDAYIHDLKRRDDVVIFDLVQLLYCGAAVETY